MHYTMYFPEDNKQEKRQNGYGNVNNSNFYFESLFKLFQDVYNLVPWSMCYDGVLIGP